MANNRKVRGSSPRGTRHLCGARGRRRLLSSVFSSQRDKKAPEDQILASSKHEGICSYHQSCFLLGADAAKGEAGTVQHWYMKLWLPAFPMGLIAQLVRAYG